MSAESPEKLVAQGNKALSDGDEHLALECLERAFQLARNPLTCSSLAYCLAKVHGNYQEAISLPREALDAEPDNPLHYLNYGRVLFLAGDEEKSLTTLRKGLEYGMHLSGVTGDIPKQWDICLYFRNGEKCWLDTSQY